MKKFLCGLLVGILLMVSVPAFGAVGQQITVAINSIKVIVNGQEMTADRFVYKDRTYVQLKELTDMLGGELLWDKENNAAIATFNLNKPTEEVNPLPLKDIEESKPATEPQAEPQNEPKTREAPPVQNQEPQQDSGGGEQPEEPDEPEPEPEQPNQTAPATTDQQSEQPQETEGTGEVDMEAYEAELAALTAQYEADIKAIDDWARNFVNNLINYYDQMIRRYPTEQQQKRIIGEREAKIEETYKSASNQKNARTAQYNADVAALRAKYGL